MGEKFWTLPWAILWMSCAMSHELCHELVYARAMPWAMGRGYDLGSGLRRPRLRAHGSHDTRHSAQRRSVSRCHVFTLGVAG